MTPRWVIMLFLVDYAIVLDYVAAATLDDDPPLLEIVAALRP